MQRLPEQFRDLEGGVLSAAQGNICRQLQCPLLRSLAGTDIPGCVVKLDISSRRNDREFSALISRNVTQEAFSVMMGPILVRTIARNYASMIPQSCPEKFDKAAKNQ